MRRRWRVLKLVAAAGAVLALLWLGGLAWFVHSSLSMASDRATPTDAIVVLTGGRLRVETALDLLDAGRAQKLFISGVNRHVDRVELLRVEGRAGPDDISRIALGHAAENTLGNARETAEWMHQEGFHSLRLVTSWYHMQRSLLEFERAMPHTTIVPEPVIAAHNAPETWPERFEAALLAIGEYNKFLVTLARPAFAMFWPRAAGAEASARAADPGTATVADRRP